MKISICLFFLIFYFSNSFSEFVMLDFDNANYRGGVSKLLEITAKLFSCSQEIDIYDVAKLEVLSNYLLDFECELHVLKKQKITFLQDDFSYLADLMFGIQNKVYGDCQGHDHSLIIVINYLFNKIQRTLSPNKFYANSTA